MRRPCYRWLQFCVAAAVLGTFTCATGAQEIPTRPIKMVVPQTAGGPLDAIARILSERMRVSLGQPVIVENVAGAAGSIGAGRVARAAPDGYTIVIGIWSTHVANAAIYSLNYDVMNDFEPIALHGSNPQVIVARKSFPASDLRGLIAWLQANPDKATVGTAGVGSPQHVFATFFQSVTARPVTFWQRCARQEKPHRFRHQQGARSSTHACALGRGNRGPGTRSRHDGEVVHRRY
jgi:tripartite-type tricarboxylate transporter receptor subunit TctC